MSLRPNLLTAAFAGVLAAVAWPYVWGRWGGSNTGGGMELIIGTILVIALPAHALVVGFDRSHEGAGDTALLKRIGAWLAAAAATTAARMAMGI